MAAPNALPDPPASLDAAARAIALQAAVDELAQRAAELEAALAEYALRYGLTPAARRLLARPAKGPGAPGAN